MKLFKHLSPDGFLVTPLPSGFLNTISNMVLFHIFNSTEYNNIDFQVLESKLLSLPPLTRGTRTLPSCEVNEVSTYLLSHLASIIPAPDYFLNNDLYFRLVRPEIDQEVSSTHRDIYFHTILPEWRSAIGTDNYKLWFPLHPIPAPALGIIPRSHLDLEYSDVVFQYTNRHKFPFSFTCNIPSDKLSPVQVPFGSCLIFPPSLIHGSLPSSDLSRVRLSVEMTLGYTN